MVPPPWPKVLGLSGATETLGPGIVIAKTAGALPLEAWCLTGGSRPLLVKLVAACLAALLTEVCLLVLVTLSLWVAT